MDVLYTYIYMSKMCGYVQYRVPSNVDVVFSSEVLHHVKDLETMIRAMHASLSANGAVCIMTRPDRVRVSFPITTGGHAQWIAQRFRSNDDELKAFRAVFGAENVRMCTRVCRVKVLAKEWFTMLRNRFWSILHPLTDAQIEQGICDIMKQYAVQDVEKDYLEFDDPIHFYVAWKRPSPRAAKL